MRFNDFGKGADSKEIWRKDYPIKIGSSINGLADGAVELSNNTYTYPLLNAGSCKEMALIKYLYTCLLNLKHMMKSLKS